MSKGLTSQNGHPRTSHQPGGTYDIHEQVEGSMDILDMDDDGDEFPAEPGLYFKQFIYDKEEDVWNGIDGWFGPYKSINDMPEEVQSNINIEQA